MIEHLIIRGLPRRLTRDGWWLSDHSDARASPTTDATDNLATGLRRGGLMVLVFLTLVVAGDVLFWDNDTTIAAIGLSLPVFSGLVFAGACALRPSTVAATRPAWFLLSCALPAIEYS